MSKQDTELRNLYERCDVSNNGTVDPISFDEFQVTIQAERTKAVNEVLDKIEKTWKKPSEQTGYLSLDHIIEAIRSEYCE